MSNLKLLAQLSPKNLIRHRSFITSSFQCAKQDSDWVPKEKVTHTGQKWDENDYRLVRFVGKEKLVNPSFAIDLIDEVPPKATTKRVVACDGGGGPTGHPKVYINLDKPGNHACGYCGLRFYLDSHH